MMTNLEAPSKSVDLLRTELDQAWIHYRHLEETRTKYLNQFFTILIGSTGFVLALLSFAKDGSGNIKSFSDESILGLSIFLLVFFAFSLTILTSIVRIGHVLSCYERIMTETRRYFHGPESSFLELWDIRNNIPGSVRKGLFSIHNSSRVSLFGACLGLISGQLFITYRLSSTAGSFLLPLFGWTLPYWWVAVAEFSVMAAILLYVWVMTLKASTKSRRDMKTPPSSTASKVVTTALPSTAVAVPTKPVGRSELVTLVALIGLGYAWLRLRKAK